MLSVGWRNVLLLVVRKMYCWQLVTTKSVMLSVGKNILLSTSIKMCCFYLGGEEYCFQFGGATYCCQLVENCTAISSEQNVLFTAVRRNVLLSAGLTTNEQNIFTPTAMQNYLTNIRRNYFCRNFISIICTFCAEKKTIMWIYLFNSYMH